MKKKAINRALAMPRNGVNASGLRSMFCSKFSPVKFGGTRSTKYS